MSEGSRSRPLWLLAAIAAMLLIAAGATAIPEAALGQKCKPECLPPEEDGEPNPGGGGGEKPPVPPKLLVVNLGWDTGVPATSSPLVEGVLDNATTYLRGPVNEWFGQAAPGIFRAWQVVRGGAYLVSPPKVLASGAGCSVLGTGSFFGDLVASGDAAAKAHGVDLSAYDVVVYVWSRQFCNFAGITDMVKGKRIGLSLLSSAQHELGHHLGLPHANSLICFDAGGNPAPPLTGNCHQAEYGDLFDTMGGGHGLYNAIYENALGWMPGQVANLSAGDYTQSVTLRPLSEVGQSPRALRLLDGSTKLWLEYRQPTGLDAPQLTGDQGLTYGLLIHREVASGVAGQYPTSELLDMSPDTGFADPGLRVGQTWADPAGEMKITLNSAGPAGATVTISNQRLTVPDVRGYTPTRAEAVIAAAGLTPGGWESVVDPTCTLIGLVAGENPPAGSRVFPGTSVRIALGEQDPKRQCQ